MMKGGKREMTGDDDNPLQDAARCHFRTGNAIGFICILMCPLFLIVSSLPNNSVKNRFLNLLLLTEGLLDSEIEKWPCRK